MRRVVVTVWAGDPLGIVLDGTGAVWSREPRDSSNSVVDVSDLPVKILDKAARRDAAGPFTPTLGAA